MYGGWYVPQGSLFSQIFQLHQFMSCNQIEVTVKAQSPLMKQHRRQQVYKSCARLNNSYSTGPTVRQEKPHNINIQEPPGCTSDTRLSGSIESYCKQQIETLTSAACDLNCNLSKQLNVFQLSSLCCKCGFMFLLLAKGNHFSGCRSPTDDRFAWRP